jgi:hypothetical protein
VCALWVGGGLVGGRERQTLILARLRSGLLCFQAALVGRNHKDEGEGHRAAPFAGRAVCAVPQCLLPRGPALWLWLCTRKKRQPSKKGGGTLAAATPQQTTAATAKTDGDVCGQNLATSSEAAAMTISIDLRSDCVRVGGDVVSEMLRKEGWVDQNIRTGSSRSDHTTHRWASSASPAASLLGSRLSRRSAL